MKIRILCTDAAHPVNAWLDRWVAEHAAAHDLEVLRDWRDLDQGGGDLLFLVSCHQIIRESVRARFRRTLVIHASALPFGRGMSPHVWQILAGAKEITVTLLDAVDELDQGDIWHQLSIKFLGTELHEEIHAKLFEAECELMSWAIAHIDRASPRQQTGDATYFRKRVPDDSRIDPQLPLAAAFDLLRVADPDRYPVFFDLRGQRYRLRIEKV